MTPGSCCHRELLSAIPAFPQPLPQRPSRTLPLIKYGSSPCCPALNTPFSFLALKYSRRIWVCQLSIPVLSLAGPASYTSNSSGSALFLSARPQVAPPQRVSYPVSHIVHSALSDSAAAFNLGWSSTQSLSPPQLHSFPIRTHHHLNPTSIPRSQIEACHPDALPFPIYRAAS